uniref:polo kinase n=1 Tax=Strongyloides papillosus TaxID=174720 RepID=A0A0N5BIZ2_STREA
MRNYEDSIKEVPKIIRDPETGTQYSRGELLESGGFGRCYLFTDLENKKKYAGKVVMRSGLSGMLNKVHQERNIHMSLEHPNILSMFCYIRCSTYICMTLELWDNTLGCVLERLKVLDEPSCRFVVREVACGISYLHENRIIHRDIKPANIFLTKDMDVKIGDFGVAVRHENSAEKIKKASGTAKFFAPESTGNSGYSFGVDVWALGVILYKIAAGCYPFDDKDMFELYEKIKNCNYNIPSKVPVHTGDMIRILLTRDPDSRPAIDDVLKHDYLNSNRLSRTLYITSCKDSHECDAIPLARCGNISKKDRKLDGNSGIENIFQEGFRISRRRLGSRIVERVEFDNAPENEYNPEKKLKLDIEVKTTIILEGIRRPKHFVARWVDNSKNYGLGYQLSDSSVGVLFIDNSCLVVDGAMENFQYIDRNGAREYFEYDKCPTELGSRFKLLEYFKNYMETYLIAVQPSEEQEGIKVVDKGIPILLKWGRNDRCICFILLNGVLQVNFLEEHTKVIISVPTKSLSIIDKDNKLKTYSYRGLVNGRMDEFMKEKMSYIKKIVDEWTSLKRKHEDDDVVLAKKSNNNNF